MSNQCTRMHAGFGVGGGQIELRSIGGNAIRECKYRDLRLGNNAMCALLCGCALLLGVWGYVPQEKQ